MDIPEYMRIHSKYCLPEIRKWYNIDDIISKDEYVDVEINKCMWQDTGESGEQCVLNDLTGLSWGFDSMSLKCSYVFKMTDLSL